VRALPDQSSAALLAGTVWMMAPDGVRADLGLCGDIPVLRLAGRMTARSAAAVHNALGLALDQSAHRLVVDLADVTALDGAATALLVAMTGRARQLGCDLLLAELPQQLTDTLRQLGAERLLRIFSRVEQAVATP
jgi:anti-anti-sigma factor